MNLVSVIFDCVAVSNQCIFIALPGHVFPIFCTEVISFSIAVSTKSSHSFSETFRNSDYHRTPAVPSHGSLAIPGIDYNFDIAATSENSELATSGER
jgi:hypothetical protein